MSTRYGSLTRTSVEGSSRRRNSHHLGSFCATRARAHARAFVVNIIHVTEKWSGLQKEEEPCSNIISTSTDCGVNRAVVVCAMRPCPLSHKLYFALSALADPCGTKGVSGTWRGIQRPNSTAHGCLVIYPFLQNAIGKCLSKNRLQLTRLAGTKIAKALEPLL